MTAGLVGRLWEYQAERFPLARVVPLLGVFSAASVSISATLASRPLPGWPAFLVAFVLAFVLFFQMRVCDEVKDAEIDRRYRPERPVPRGLVTLDLLIGLGIGAGLVAVAVALAWTLSLFWLLLLTGLWLAAMTVEFGVPEWLRRRPLAYLVSHMAIMPLIDVMLTGAEWTPHGAPAPGLAIFLALSFANGCVLELGRKTWAPESEREGVESYSGIWGAVPAARIWLGTVVAAFGLLVALGLATGQPLLFALLGGAGLAACAQVARAFMRAPSRTSEKRLDTAAGLWVFACYAIAGLVPVLSVPA